MIIKLKKKNIVFRNPQLFAGEAKTINLENVLSNLFQLISTGGAPISLATPKGGHTMNTLMDAMKTLENTGKISGTSDNIEAVEDWLRSNLVNMVFRGNVVKENVSSLRPMHLMSYRIQNKKHNRDYSMSDQVYMMLKSDQAVMDGLKEYLNAGWDSQSSNIVNSDQLDVDTAGILLLQQTLPKDKKKPVMTVNNDKPLLADQTALFNDDIRRLLYYKDKLPRNVFIEYLKILAGFHLTLYVMKLIYLLPKMREAGTIDIVDEWSMVVDMTDDLDSKVSAIACKDVERMVNTLDKYFRTTFEINVVQEYNKVMNKNSTIDGVLNTLKNDLDRSSPIFVAEIKQIMDSVDDDDDRKAIEDMLQYYDENDYFGRYIHILEKTNGGNSYQFPFYLRMIDSLSMKNSESMLLADGRRSRKHPRRGVLGSKLLETLVQLLVLTPDGNGSYISHSLSIDELTKLIRKRYGLVINGIGEERFDGADVETHAAFQENVEALKNKLRQIGFYTDLSDACLLQKIRPRY